MDLILNHLQNGLLMTLFLSLPIVLTAATVGLVVGILQAVTQVQEQTIAAAPKITLVFLVIIFGGGIMLNVIENYFLESAAIAFEEIPRSEAHILPPASRQRSR